MQDTVKVDPNMMPFGQDKENVRPPSISYPVSGQEKMFSSPLKAYKSEAQQSYEAEQLKLLLEQEEQLRAEREAERRREEELQKQAEEDARRQQEMAALEKRRLEEEVAAEVARRGMEEEAAAEEERLRQDALRAAEEKARLEASAAADKERLRAEEEKRLAQTKAKIWCQNNGYQDVFTPKRTFKGNTKFALHTAVKYESVGIVRMLMLCGANKDDLDSKGHSPLQLAEKIKDVSLRDQIVDALMGHAQ
jgi:hypothetical protein